MHFTIFVSIFNNWSLEFHGLVCRADNFTKKPKNLSKTVDITAK